MNIIGGAIKLWLVHGGLGVGEAIPKSGDDRRYNKGKAVKKTRRNQSNQTLASLGVFLL